MSSCHGSSDAARPASKRDSLGSRNVTFVFVNVTFGCRNGTFVRTDVKFRTENDGAWRGNVRFHQRDPRRVLSFVRTKSLISLILMDQFNANVTFLAPKTRFSRNDGLWHRSHQTKTAICPSKSDRHLGSKSSFGRCKLELPRVAVDGSQRYRR